MSSSSHLGARGARRRTRATITGAAALVAAAAFAVPAQGAVTNGAAIEVFQGRDFVNIVGYDRNTPLQVVVRDGAGIAVGFADVQTDGAGNYELNHVGVDGATNDCFGGATSPDIVPGDTVQITVNGDATRVDTTVVQNVQYPDPAFAVDSAAHTITVTGFAKTPAGAPLGNVEVRLNHPSGVWDAPGASGRKDWRVQGSIDLAGNFTAVFADASNADLGNVPAADISAQWSNADLSELTVFDGLVTVANPGCPPLARRPIAVPPPVVKGGAAGAGGAGGAATTAPKTGVTSRQGIKGVTANALRVSRLAVARRIGRARLNRRGLQAGMRLPSGTQALRIAVYRARDGRRTGRALLVANRRPRSAGIYRIALRDRRLLRKLRPGRYVLEVRAGRSAATLGTATSAGFTVTR